MRYLGPKATPTVDDASIYTLSHDGRLQCLSADRGDVLWSADLMRDMGRKPPRFGYAASPLVCGRLLIVPAMADHANLVAFDKNNGRVVWRSGEWSDGHSTSFPCQLAGAKRLVFFTGRGLQIADAAPARYGGTIRSSWTRARR